MEHASVYVTCPDHATARRIAAALLERRLVACANLFPITSMYRWQGETKEEGEVAMFLKTRRALVGQVVEAVKSLHPYEVPCAVGFDLLPDGLAAYHDWVSAETDG